MQAEAASPPDAFARAPGGTAEGAGNEPGVHVDTRAQRWLLAVLLAALLVLKAIANTSIDDMGVDGSLYLDFAQHVRDGAGLVTDASLYHAGFPSFPHPSPIYPVWPWLLGMAGKLGPLDVVAPWLATACYFGSLVAFYVWGRRLAPAPVFGAWWSVPHGGHLAVALLGLNDRYFEHTTKPYTEGLAFLVLGIALLRFQTYFTRPSLLRGLECGAWLGFLFLVRAQMIVSAAGWFAAAGWMTVAVTPRLPRLAGLVGGGVGFAAMVLPYLLHVRGYLPGAGFGDLLRFERFQASSGLSHIELLVQTEGLWAWIVDRAGGFVVAFDESSAHSYFKAFGSVYWSAPIAAAVLGWDLLRAARRGEHPWRKLVDPASQHALFLLVFAVGWFLSLHVLHKATFAAWNFPMRHALPCLFLFGMSNLVLLRRGGALRLVGVFLLSVTLHRGVSQCLDALDDVKFSSADRRSRDGIVRLLDATVKARGPQVIATPRAQRLAAWTSGVGLHGVYDQTTLPELLHLVDTLGVQLVAVADDGEQPAFLEDPLLGDHFVAVLGGPTGWKLWVPSSFRALPSPSSGAPTP